MNSTEITSTPSVVSLHDFSTTASDPRVVRGLSAALLYAILQTGILGQPSSPDEQPSGDNLTSSAQVEPNTIVKVPLALTFGCKGYEPAPTPFTERVSRSDDKPKPKESVAERPAPTPVHVEEESSGCQKTGQKGLAGFTFLGALGATIARIFPGDSKAERLVSGVIAVPSTLLGACSMMASGVTPELFLATLAAAGVSAWAIFGKGKQS